jgi:Na+-transporting NADH:ubiquinone oxidoreductase subunit NqrB
MFRLLLLASLFLPGLLFGQLTDPQLSSQLQQLIPDNTKQLITPASVRKVTQDGYDARISIYGNLGIKGLLGYNTLFTLTNDKQLVHKKYVDDKFASIGDSLSLFITLAQSRAGFSAPGSFFNYNPISGVLGTNYTPLGTNLSDGKIYIGNSSGVATERTPSGDMGLSNLGVFTLPPINSNIGEFNNITLNAKGQGVSGRNISYVLLSDKNTTGTMGNSNVQLPTEFAIRNFINSLGFYSGSAPITSETDPIFSSQGVFSSGSYPNASFIPSLAWNKITGAPAFLTTYTETDPLSVKLAGNYTNPSWINSLPWSKITGAPSFLTSYTETDPLAVKLAGSYSNPSFIGSLAWSKITGAPSFLTSYTETDPLAVKLAGSYANPSFINSLAYSKLTGAPTNLSAFTNGPGYLTSFTELDPLAVKLSGSYSNPSFITSLIWSKITGAPSFLTSYTETDPLAVKLSGSYANPSWISSLAWSKIIGAPTFLTSYTETDPLAVKLATVYTNPSFIGSLPYSKITGTPDLSLKEDKANKKTDLASPNNTTYPTTKAVSDAINAVAAGAPALTTANPIGYTGGKLFLKGISGLGNMQGKYMRVKSDTSGLELVDIPVTDTLVVSEPFYFTQGTPTVLYASDLLTVLTDAEGDTLFAENHTTGRHLGIRKASHTNDGVMTAADKVTLDSLKNAAPSVTPGSKVDITVIDQTNWQINSGVVGTAELGAGAVTGAKLENVGSAGQGNLITFDSHGRETVRLMMPYLTRDSIGNIYTESQVDNLLAAKQKKFAVKSPLEYDEGSDGFLVDPSGHRLKDPSGNEISDPLNIDLLSVKVVSSSDTGVVAPWMKAYWDGKQDVLNFLSPLSKSGSDVVFTPPGSNHNLLYNNNGSVAGTPNVFYNPTALNIGTNTPVFQALLNIEANNPEVYKPAMSVRQAGSGGNIAVYSGNKSSVSNFIDNTGVSILQEDTTNGNYSNLAFFHGKGLASAIIGARNTLQGHELDYTTNGDFFVATTKNGIININFEVKSDGTLKSKKFATGVRKLVAHDENGNLIDTAVTSGGGASGLTSVGITNTGGGLSITNTPLTADGNININLNLTSSIINTALGYTASDDANVVHKTGTETVLGTKKFQDFDFIVQGASDQPAFHVHSYFSGSTSSYTDISSLNASGTPASVIKSIPNSGSNSYLYLRASGTGNIVADGSDFVLGKHLISSTTSPTSTIGVGSGTSASVSVTGTDVAGKITINTGTGSMQSLALLATITFSSAYTSAPTVTLQPGNSTTSALSGSAVIYPAVTTTTLTLNSGGTSLNTSQTYVWYYQIIQ